MPAINNFGWLHRANVRNARLWRALRRTYHQRFLKKPYDLDQIEDQYFRALFRKAAAQLGLEAFELGRVLCFAGRGKLFRVWDCTTELDSFPLYAIVEDKALINKLFAESGFTVPEGRAFPWQDHSAGVAYALSLGRLCVIKPAMETKGGKGVTTRLTKRADIARAFRYAGLFSSHVLIEEFVPGDCYRFLVYKGRCLSVVRRELPAVKGNGISTVRELVEAENCNRTLSANRQADDPLSVPMPIDSTALRHLRRQGFGWNSVPRRGEILQLAGASNLSFGCTYTEVLRRTHPDLIRAAEQASNSLGLKIGAVDIIAAAIDAPAYHLLEINIAPSIELHYMIRNLDEATDPIRTILADYFEIGEPESAA